MIYYSGERVEIVGRVGDVHVPGYSISLTLLKCKSLDKDSWGAIRWRFKEFMRADGAWTEIVAMAGRAPRVILEPDELQRAVAEARSV